jgi:hypothetical protein
MANLNPQSPDCNDQYSEQESGTYYRNDRLANFTARITREVICNDFISQHRWYHVSAQNERGAWSHVQVPAEKFAAMSWTGRLGAEFVIAPGRSRKDRLRYVILSRSHPDTISA